VREAFLRVQAVDPELVLSFLCVHARFLRFRRRFPVRLSPDKRIGRDPLVKDPAVDG